MQCNKSLKPDAQTLPRERERERVACRCWLRDPVRLSVSLNCVVRGNPFVHGVERKRFQSKRCARYVFLAACNRLAKDSGFFIDQTLFCLCCLLLSPSCDVFSWFCLLAMFSPCSLSFAWCFLKVLSPSCNVFSSFCLIHGGTLVPMSWLEFKHVLVDDKQMIDRYLVD